MDTETTMTEEQDTYDLLHDVMSDGVDNELLNLTTDENVLIPTIQDILHWPHEILKTTCEPVVDFNRELEQLVIDLFATMKHHNGVGIAASQIGELKQLVLVWIERETPLILVNPTITERSDELYEFEEGCLSVPGVFITTKRSERIVVEYQDVTGKAHSIESNGLTAFVIQHELDHLVGKTIADDIGLMQRMFNNLKNKK